LKKTNIVIIIKDYWNKIYSYKCAVVVLRGKMSKIEEVFFGSACYASQEAPSVSLCDQRTGVPSLMRKRGARRAE
jgi:hypothetical protein